MRLMVTDDADSRSPPTWRHTWGEADFVGGHPALDFLNTVADTEKTRETDKVGDWPAFRAWATASGLLSEGERKRFLQRPSLDSESALAALHRFREDAYAVLVALAKNDRPDNAALARLVYAIRGAVQRSSFDIDAGRLLWRACPSSPHRWQDAVALALEQLLRSGDLGRLRQCARCTWLFIDRGRGAGRRWCDMRTCGNRAKIETFRRP
jgi:predicted RNA-binding Zn ribbon-like protein